MELSDLFTKFFDQSFASRWNGTCNGWTRELAIAHITTDVLIWLSYMAIPILLIKLIKVRKDLPFNFFISLFAIFIISCGLTHLAAVITSFYPLYYMDFWIKAIAAVASVGTACLLWKSYPQILNLPNPLTSLDTIAKMNQDLQNANKELDNFALIAAHDLQDPIKQNNVLIKMIQDGKLEFLPLILKNNNKMNDFIKSLLTFARSGGTNLKFESVDLNETMKKVMQDLQVIIDEQKPEIIVSSLPTIQCDQIQIGRVFQNLIKNAIKSKSPKRPLKIEINVSETEDMYICSIKDNGIGLPKERLPFLFAIYRGKKIDSTGVGFGLAICKRIVESHGGTIIVDSQEDKGSCFTFTIDKEKV